MPDWNKIKADYIRGGASYRKLADKYGVSFSSIYRKAKVEKWTDLRKQTKDKMTTKLVESVAKSESERVDIFNSIADQLLRQIQQGIEDGSLDISKRGVCRDITGALKDLKDIKGIRSEMDIQEQMARIEKLRMESRVEEENKEVRVIISDGLKEYAE